MRGAKAIVATIKASTNASDRSPVEDPSLWEAMRDIWRVRGALETEAEPIARSYREMPLIDPMNVVGGVDPIHAGYTRMRLDSDHARLSTVAEAEATLPYPPLELAHRVGSLAGTSDPLEYYDKLGRETRDGIMENLPPGWTFVGKRVLDFGCGAGRTLRHFVDEADEAEFWGCDIDEASIDWMREEMPSPFHVFANGSDPPIDQPDSSFDLIWAISVFTHLAPNWSQWLTELHRVLKPDGLLLATFMGCGMSEEIAGEPWDEDSVGMNIIKYGQSWDLGGPMVLHSPWWIEEHWGRAFEILSLQPDGFAEKPWLDHGCVLMRKLDRKVDPEELQRATANDPREISALAHSVEQLQDECVELREGLQFVESQLEGKDRLLQERSSELERVREEGVSLGREANALRQEAANLHRKTALAQQQEAVARETSLISAQKLLAVEEIMAQSKARIFALEEVVYDIKPRLERADRIMASMQASVSWRITKPLRVLKRVRGG
jgi:SAM-dependent methyltransferase